MHLRRDDTEMLAKDVTLTKILFILLFILRAVCHNCQERRVNPGSVWRIVLETIQIEQGCLLYATNIAQWAVLIVLLGAPLSYLLSHLSLSLSHSSYPPPHSVIPPPLCQGSQCSPVPEIAWNHIEYTPERAIFCQLPTQTSSSRIRPFALWEKFRRSGQSFLKTMVHNSIVTVVNSRFRRFINTLPRAHILRR